VREGRASRTAEHNALFRALEARRPAGERVVDDQFAAAFLRGSFKALVAAARFGPCRDALIRIIDRGWPGVRATVVARTRLIDGLVTELVDGLDQVVILGAGFDTRAWRLPALQGPTVFEVDHPDTQRAKRAVVARLGDAADPPDPPDVRFVPTDFHLGRLSAAMAEAGFAAVEPSLFLWEGTTNYLTADAVDATLRWCATAAAGSHLVFTYIDEDVLTDPGRYHGAERVLASVGRTGESMTFGLPPAGLGSYLAERGLTLVSDEGAAEFRPRFLGAAADGQRGHEFYRVARATVAA
jgi:methyltransferase (TIGR00027 family)